MGLILVQAGGRRSECPPGCVVIHQNGHRDTVGASAPPEVAVTPCLEGSTKGGMCVHAKLLQLCLTLCSPMDLPGSSVPGILQARTLEWVAISFSGGSF